MQTRDDQMIFEKYQQIDEITLPFTGGKQMSIGKRLKKFIPGRIGNRASNQINVETDVNHFIGDLQDYADTTGTTVEEVIADTQKFNNWVQDTIKVNPQHIKNWSKLVAAAVAESKKMMHGYKALSAALTAAIYQRNEELRVSNRGQYAQQSAPEAPATPKGSTSAPQTTNASSAQPAAAVTQPATEPKSITVAQSKKAIDDAAATVGSVRTRDRARLIDYALDKFAAVEGSKQPAAASTSKSTPAASIRTVGNVKPSASRKNKVTAKESVYINSSVVTEDIKFIDCSKF